MTELAAAGYRADVDTVDGGRWHECVADFCDASLYQVWGVTKPGEPGKDVSHFVLRDGDGVVAAAEVRLFTIPLTRRGVAYVLWGPMWKRDVNGGDPRVFRQAIRGLRNEYAVRRGMILRIVPRMCLEQSREYVDILVEEGFRASRHRKSAKSLLVDLSGDLSRMRGALDQKWRNCLNKAERAGLEVVSGSDVELFDEFTNLYAEMVERKAFAPSADIEKHRRIQEILPVELKMDVVLVRHEEQTCAGAIYSSIGDTAVYLFGATNERGMRTCGSYLVQWSVLKQLKERGVSRYDLNGISARGNPGVYHFKRGLAGRNGLEVTLVGEYQSFEASIANGSLLLADRVRLWVQEARSSLSRASA
jgi:hypothetical protein